MSMPELVEELQTLAKLKNNWYAVAEAVQRVKQQHAGRAHIPREIKAACDASGFSQNTINRMLAVKGFFDSVAGKVKALGGVDPNSLSFPSLEVVKRLHQVNPEEGLSMLARVAKGDITFRTLRERYNRLITEDFGKASAHQISKREGADFEEAVLDRVGIETEMLFGVGKNMVFSVPTAMNLPFQVSFVAQEVSSDGACNDLYGIEVFYFRGEENFKKRMELFLQRLFYAANFFTAMWVVFPSDMGRERIKAFVKILDLSGYSSIGVATIPWEGGKEAGGSFNVVRQVKPLSTGSPTAKLKAFTELHQLLTASKK